MSRTWQSRAGHNARISAAYDRAAAADRLQRTLEDAGYDVTRLIGEDATVVLEQPSGIPGLVNEWRYTAATVFDAMQDAVSDQLNDRCTTCDGTGRVRRHPANAVLLDDCPDCDGPA